MNAYLNPTVNEILIKTERAPVVKTEIDEMPYETETIQNHTTNRQILSLNEEKQQMIKDLVHTKGQNQKLILQLQQKLREIDRLKTNSTETISSLSKKVETITSNLNHSKQQLTCEKLKNQKLTTIITDLQREKSMLAAQISELQTTSQMHYSTPSEAENNCAKNDESKMDDDFYDVECILDHRIYKRFRKFLVRWEGYSSEHDMWVSEKDLECRSILVEYLEEHSLDPPKFI